MSYFVEKNLFDQEAPILFKMTEQNKFVKVFCGDTHVVAMTDDENLYGWGNIKFGKVPLIEDINSEVSEPRHIHLHPFRKTIETDEKSKYRKLSHLNEEAQGNGFDETIMKIDSIACGHDRSFFVINHKVFACGKSNLGVGLTNIISKSYLKETGATPYIIYNLFNFKIKGVAVGKSHALAWDTEGFIYSWGDAEYGKLGHPVDKELIFGEEILPRQIQALESERIVQAACGERHSIALTNSGQIYMWGKTDTYEQGAHPAKETTFSFESIRPKKLVPVKEDGKSGDVSFVKIVSGSFHNAAIDRNGILYTWGDGSLGCLGHQEVRDRHNPTIVKELIHKRVIDMSCGERFTCIIVVDEKSKFKSQCVEEFNKNALRTIKERLGAIDQYKRSKHEFRIQTKKNEKSDHRYDHKVLLTQTSPKAIQSQIRHHFIDNEEKFKKKMRSSSSPHRHKKKGRSEKLELESPTRPSEVEISKERSQSPFLEELMIPTSESKIDSQQQLSQQLLKPQTEPILPQEELIIDLEQQKHVTEPRKSHLIDRSYNNTPKSIDSPMPRPFNKELVKTFTSKFAEELARKSPKKSRSPNKDKNHHSHLTYVFDDVTDKINEKAEYQTSFDMFIRKVQPFDDPFEIINEKYDKALKDQQSTIEKMSSVAKRNHLREGFFNVGKSKASRPQTATSKSMANLKPLKVANTHTQIDDYLSLTGVAESFRVTKNTMALSRPMTATTQAKKSMKNPYKKVIDLDAERLARYEAKQDEVAQRTKEFNQKKVEKLQEQSLVRNEKIVFAQYKKAEKQREREQKMQDSVYKRSNDFKEISKHIQERKIVIENMQKSWILFLGLNHIAQMSKFLLEDVRAVRKLGITQSIKARVIQKRWRKFQVVKRMNELTPKQLHTLRLMAIQFVYKRKRKMKIIKARKILLAMHYFNLYKKVGQKLLYVRNTIIPIQKFINWARRMHRLRLRKLAYSWDLHLLRMVNFKLLEEPKNLFHHPNAKPLILKKEASNMAKKPEMGKVETYLHKEAKTIEQESQILQPKQEESKSLVPMGGIKSTFEVLLDRLKLRGAGVTIGNNPVEHEPQSMKEIPGENAPTKSPEKKSARVNEIPSFVTLMKETILAYSINGDEITFGTNYMVKKETQSLHEKMLSNLVEFEARLKAKIINDIYREKVKQYYKELGAHEEKLTRFIRMNKNAIDLERAKILMRTPKETLVAISKKEDLEYRMYMSHQHNRRQISNLTIADRDHLPFAKLKVKIASAMPNSPQLPNFKNYIHISYDEFKTYFRRYYEEYRNFYIKLSQVTRSGLLVGKGMKSQ